VSLSALSTYFVYLKFVGLFLSAYVLYGGLSLVYMAAKFHLLNNIGELNYHQTGIQKIFCFDAIKPFTFYRKASVGKNLNIFQHLLTYIRGLEL